MNIYRAAPIDDHGVEELLVSAGVDRYTAARLVEFLPLAYGRSFLADTGVKFSEFYIRADKNGNLLPEQALASVPMWNEIIAFIQSEIENGIEKVELAFVATNSAELKAAADCWEKGEKLRDLVFAPPIFLHPTDEQEAKQVIDQPLKIPIIPIPDNKVKIQNEKLATKLSENHIPIIEKDKFIQIIGTDVMIQASVNPKAITSIKSTVQLDVSVRSQKLLGNRELVESFAENGEELDEVIDKSFDSFYHASLHAILAVFINRKYAIKQTKWERWSNSKQSWDVCIGPLIPKMFGAFKGQKIIDGGNYQSLVKTLRDAYLQEVSFDIHWLRIYRASIQGKMLIREVLLDGKHWNAGEAIFDGWDWPAGPYFYSFRQFMIAVPAQVKKRWWQF